MLDHILGRPSTRLKRAQVLTVLSLGLLALRYGDRNGPKRMHWIRWLNARAQHSNFTPWQIVVCTVTAVYAIRNLDHLLGFGAPEPLARMYSRAFYRTTWINTALDAGFATAMPIRPQWLKDILALLFSGYYLIYANEADEKLRKFRAFCTVEMMRETWHKTTNPYIRLATWIHRPSLPIAREVLLPRPTLGRHASRPTVAWLFFDGDDRALRQQSELILDIPGGGFIAMDPRHHEERLRALAKQTGRPVLALNYCKAPEFPFPFALEECYDAYRTLYETRGAVIGMNRLLASSATSTTTTTTTTTTISNHDDPLALEKELRIILSGDSAGGNLATGVMMKIIEYPQPHIELAYADAAASSGTTRKAIDAKGGSLPAPPPRSTKKGINKPPPLPKPIAILLAYPSLNFAYSSWMKPEYIRVLRQQSEVNLQTMRQQSETSAAAARANQQAAAAAAAASASGGTHHAYAHHQKMVTPAQSPLNPNRSGRRPSLNARVGLPSSLEEERRQQLRAAGIIPSSSSSSSTAAGAGAGAGTGTERGAVQGGGADARSARSPRPLGLVPPPGVPPIVTSPTAILTTFMDKAHSVLRRSTSRGTMDISSVPRSAPPTAMVSGASGSSAVGATGAADAKQQRGPATAMPKRDRSYSSLAGQAQMHLVERARFAEAEPSASEDEAGGAGPSGKGPYVLGSFGDEEDNQDADAVDSLQEAQRQYHQRVLALSASNMQDSASAGAGAEGLAREAGEDGGTSSGYNTEHESRAHAEQQKQLRAAAAASDARMRSARAKRGGRRAYGTRLTMTSMAGYFNDRILTQSMMRAMAILYIGPKYQPDFEGDYYLSPIVAPAALLAEFPPCLFICGEKDPICDDTVVMAGRIREAKTAKKRNLERRRAGPSARFGEGLRMSSAPGPSSSQSDTTARDPIEDESPEDWVQMRIIEGWSHGFLQMSALMPEAKEVIKFLGVWMWETFEDWNVRNGVFPPPMAAAAGAGEAVLPMEEEEGEGQKGAVALNGTRAALRRASEGDEDDDEPLSFTTTKSKSMSAGRAPTPSHAPGGGGEAAITGLAGASPFLGGGGGAGGSSPAVPGRAAAAMSSTFAPAAAAARVERSVSPMSRPAPAPAPVAVAATTAAPAIPATTTSTAAAAAQGSEAPVSAPTLPSTSAATSSAAARAILPSAKRADGDGSGAVSTSAVGSTSAATSVAAAKSETPAPAPAVPNGANGPVSSAPTVPSVTRAPVSAIPAAPGPASTATASSSSAAASPSPKLSAAKALNGQSSTTTSTSGNSSKVSLLMQQQQQDERERRGSGSAGGGLDEKYKSMLVQESQLLQRRRGEAVFGLVEGAVHDGSDEEHEHEEDGEGEGENLSR
ncbi:hypothetical protein OC844_006064 [Tilletia horrida]|nr:hypothetical protein OC844_006064 [Tilletia horrida]